MIPYPTWLGSGDNAWQMTAATLVGLMSIPALAVLYGGLVQKKWAMNTTLMVFVTFCLVLITWVLWAYKMGFGAPLVGTFLGDPRTILGALSVYAVLGILFTFAYGTIDRIEGGPFFEGVHNPHGGDFIFFSYTTLTTTGYGNLVPTGQAGRMVAGLEMMAGQIFLVTLVAGLVSLWRPGESLRRRRERRNQTTAGPEVAPGSEPAPEG